MGSIHRFLNKLSDFTLNVPPAGEEPLKKGGLWVAKILAIIASGGIILVTSLLWRKLKPVEQSTQQQQDIAKIFATTIPNSAAVAPTAKWVQPSKPTFETITNSHVSSNSTIHSSPINPLPQKTDAKSPKAYKIQFVGDIVTRLNIKIEKEEIKKSPDQHLDQFAEFLNEFIDCEKEEKKFQEVPRCEVIFLNKNLEEGEGIDEGGPTRDYLDDLFAGVLDSSKIVSFNKEKFALPMPQAKQSYNSQTNEFPKLSTEELDHFKKMGQLFSYAYLKDKAIGFHFDKALFKVVLTLTSEEINQSFEQLPIGTKLKIAKALIDAEIDEGVKSSEGLSSLFDNLIHFEDLTDSQLEAVAFKLEAEYLNDDWLLTSGKADLEKIKNQRHEFKKAIVDEIEMSLKDLGPLIAPVHAIAQGMKSLYRAEGQEYSKRSQKDLDNQWDSFRVEISYVNLNEQIQGSLNRKTLADQIVIDESVLADQRQEISKKVQWLKDWLLDEENGATDEEIKAFVKFLTASSAISKNKTIKVKAQANDAVPFPIAHTCSFQLDLASKPSSYLETYNDHDKENFIKGLKEVALANPNEYSRE